MNETTNRDAGTNGRHEAGPWRELGAGELAGVGGGGGLISPLFLQIQLQIQYADHLMHNAWAFWGF